MSPVQSLEVSTAVNNFSSARESWMVSYEINGRECSGTVLGFSDVGWHIAGEIAVCSGATLTLQVHMPKKARTFRISSVRVQSVEGLLFTVRIDLSRAPRMGDESRLQQGTSWPKY